MYSTNSNYFKTHDRYLHQGQEMDNEVKGEGNSYDFGARLLDPRLGRWLTIDSRSDKYPMDSPYMSFGNNPISVIDPDGNEKIVVVGSENREWKLGFVLPGLKAAKELKNIAGDEQTTLLLFKAGYSDGQMKRIQKYANKKGITVQVLTSSDDLVNYFNNKSIKSKESGRKEDPITHVEIFCHGTITNTSGACDGALNFGYHQGDAIESKYRFDIDDVKKINSSSFDPNAQIFSYACRTGAGKDVGESGSDTDPEKSLAQSMANQFGVTIYALQCRSEYKNVISSDPKKSWIENYFDSTFDNEGGSWDTDKAMTRVNYPVKADTPSGSPGWTEYKKGKKPVVLKE
jgi:RHS repeat-associated protein